MLEYDVTNKIIHSNTRNIDVVLTVNLVSLNNTLIDQER